MPIIQQEDWPNQLLIVDVNENESAILEYHSLMVRLTHKTGWISKIEVDGKIVTPNEYSGGNAYPAIFFIGNRAIVLADKMGGLIPPYRIRFTFYAQSRWSLT